MTIVMRTLNIVVGDLGVKKVENHCNLLLCMQCIFTGVGV